jgi:hypothetical protein
MRTEGAAVVDLRQDLVSRASYTLKVDLGLCDAARMIEQDA